jgi:hypothetical protein
MTQLVTNRRLGALALALQIGVVALFGPASAQGDSQYVGYVMALALTILWARRRPLRHVGYRSHRLGSYWGILTIPLVRDNVSSEVFSMTRSSGADSIASIRSTSGSSAASVSM